RHDVPRQGTGRTRRAVQRAITPHGRGCRDGSRRHGVARADLGCTGAGDCRVTLEGYGAVGGGPVTIDLMAGGRAYRVTVDPDGSGESGVVTIGLQPVDDDAPARVRRARVERTAHGVLLTDLADGRP